MDEKEIKLKIDSLREQQEACLNQIDKLSGKAKDAAKQELKKIPMEKQSFRTWLFNLKTKQNEH